jgi:iron complex transport system substrate-binding protein
VIPLRRALRPLPLTTSRRFARYALLAALPALLDVSVVQALELRDDRGVTIRLAAPAQRIVTLSPHLTELVYAAGAGSQLVGVARYSDYPPAARDLQQIGDAARVDMERIIALKPDLVLAWRSGNQPGDIARLERLGIPVWVSEAGRVADVPRLLRATGTLAGTADAAGAMADGFERDIATLRKQHASRPPVRVYYEIWHRPLLTVNGNHIINDVIEICGGRNVFANARTLTPAVTEEAVIAARPDAILGGGSRSGPEEFSAHWKSGNWALLGGVEAYYVVPDTIQRPTTRLIEGARSICAHLEQARHRSAL